MIMQMMKIISTHEITNIHPWCQDTHLKCQSNKHRLKTPLSASSMSSSAAKPNKLCSPYCSKARLSALTRSSRRRKLTSSPSRFARTSASSCSYRLRTSARNSSAKAMPSKSSAKSWPVSTATSRLWETEERSSNSSTTSINRRTRSSRWLATRVMRRPR